jgi:hypothetical protein
MLIDYENYLPDLNEKSRKALISRAEQIVLDRELDRLTEEIMATRQALKLENVDKQFLANRAKSLGDRLQHIKNKRRELETSPKRLPLENLIDFFNRPTSIPSNFPGLSSSKGDESSYTRDETFSRDRSEVRKQLNREMELVRESIRHLKHTIRELEEKETELLARYEIDDISRSRFTTVRNEIKKDLEILDVSQEILERLLREAESVVI